MKVHWCEMIKPDAFHPQIIGYSVWFYCGHPLLGEVQGSHRIVKTKYERQKIVREMNLEIKKGGKL